MSEFYFGYIEIASNEFSLQALKKLQDSLSLLKEPSQRRGLKARYLTKPSAGWIQIEPLGGFSYLDPSNSLAKELSGILRRRVITLSAHSMAFVGGFGLFENGEVVRFLSGGETLFENIGDRLPWEKEICPFPSENPTLAVGGESPISSDSLKKIARHYGLPGFHVPPEEKDSYWTTLNL